MVSTLVSAINVQDYYAVVRMLEENPELSKAIYDDPDNGRKPVLSCTYSTNTETMKRIRGLLFEKGADVNYQSDDGATLGQYLACVATEKADPRALYHLISWIQDGGDVTLEDSQGDNLIKSINKLAFVILKENKIKVPGYTSTSAVILGLDKRNPFPSRLEENGINDNADEIEERAGKPPKLFNELRKRKLTIKDAYEYSTIASRAFKELLVENGADINSEIDGDEGGNLGHVLAMEAANHNDQRHYLALIHWIRDGGNVEFVDKLGRTAFEKLGAIAYSPSNRTPLPGLMATAIILSTVKADIPNDPAAKTDSRTYKHYPNANHLCRTCHKPRKQVEPDPDGTQERALRVNYKNQLLSLMNDVGSQVADIAHEKPLKITAKLTETPLQLSISKYAFAYYYALFGR